MSKELRGSEKLAGSCTSMVTLSQEEMDQVAGGAVILGFNPDYFPFGTINPLLAAIKQDLVKIDPRVSAVNVLDRDVLAGNAGVYR